MRTNPTDIPKVARFRTISVKITPEIYEFLKTYFPTNQSAPLIQGLRDYIMPQVYATEAAKFAAEEARYRAEIAAIDLADAEARQNVSHSTNNLQTIAADLPISVESNPQTRVEQIRRAHKSLDAFGVLG